LYGNGKIPASPTPKPAAMEFLQSVQCVVLDEVDRLLNIKKSRAENTYKKNHEKPAAVLVAAIMRLSVGKAQIVCASATVGRPLKRELTRVMGLPFKECPRVVVAAHNFEFAQESATTSTRAVTVPRGVQHFVVEAKGGQSDGKLLTAAYLVIQKLDGPRRILLVLNRNFGLSTKNVVGALKHFQCQPTPECLLDRLYGIHKDGRGGTESLMEAHRQVSGASGGNNSEYLLVANENSVRGLHLDGLDLVIVLGRPNTPDEYVHIAGRTGRAGQSGKVLCVVGTGKAASLQAWESILGIRFQAMDVSRN
jgi:superfamily II DNA/RNA helicase